jgi:hypothetical protein
LLLAGLALTLLLSGLSYVPADDQPTKPELKPKKPDDKKPTPGIKGADIEKNPNVHKMTLMVGQTKTVQYFSKSGSPVEEEALRELAKAENDALYSDDLHNLKRQIVSNEREMEARRHQVQMKLYGRNIETTTNASNKVTGYSPYMPVDGVGLLSPTFTGGFNVGQPITGAALQAAQLSGGSLLNPNAGGPFGNLIRGINGINNTTIGNNASLSPLVAASLLTGGLGSSFNPFGFGLNAATPFGGAFNGFAPSGLTFNGAGPFGVGLGGLSQWPTFGAGYGTPYGPYGLGINPADVDSYTQSSTTKLSESLAHGMGDEGRFKGELVAQIAREATSGYSSEAQRKLTNAQGDVRAIMYPKEKERIRPAGDADKGEVILYLKDGRRVEGVLVTALENVPWVKVWTPNKDVMVRPDQISSVDILPK